MFSVKSEKTWNVLAIVVLVLQVLAEIMTTVIILQLDMLPGLYIALLIGLMLLPIAGVALLFFLKGKAGVGLPRRIIACALALLVVVILRFCLLLCIDCL